MLNDGLYCVLKVTHTHFIKKKLVKNEKVFRKFSGA